MKIVRPFVKTVGSLSITVRDANRFREVALVLARHGLGALVSGVDIPAVDSNTTVPSKIGQARKSCPTFIVFRFFNAPG